MHPCQFKANQRNARQDNSSQSKSTQDNQDNSIQSIPFTSKNRGSKTRASINHLALHNLPTFQSGLSITLVVPMTDMPYTIAENLPEAVRRKTETVAPNLSIQSNLSGQNVTEGKERLTILP